jgi:hypothetical protein
MDTQEENQNTRLRFQDLQLGIGACEMTSKALDATVHLDRAHGQQRRTRLTGP